MLTAKRKYTVSEKSLAANRRNLILARAVDPKVRCRPTDRRSIACRANLEKALAVLRAASLTPEGHPQKKAESRSQKSENGNAKLESGNSKIESTDLKSQITSQQSQISSPPLQSPITNHQSQISFPDSPAYGTCFTRGLYAVSLRRSARLAGESTAEFDAHLALFSVALAPRTPREQKLARGIAETVWRRLRLYRGQARWERASLEFRLRQAARGPTPQQWEDGLLTPAGLARDLTWEIGRIFSSASDLIDAAGKLNARLERLSRLWVVGRGCDSRLFECAARPRATDGLLLKRSAVAMRNPFTPLGVIETGLEHRAARPLPHFAVTGYGYRPPAGLRDLGYWDDRNGDATRYGLMQQIALHGSGSRAIAGPPALDGSEGAFPDSYGAGAGDIPSPAADEEIKALWALALESISTYSHTRVSVTVTGDVPGEEKAEFRNQKPETGNLLKSQILNHKSQLSSAPDTPLPTPHTHFPGALLSRLRLYSDLAGCEDAEVKSLLMALISGRMHEVLAERLERLPQDLPIDPSAEPVLTPAADGGTGAFLMELVLLFNRSNNVTAEDLERNRALRLALDELIESRFGGDESTSPHAAIPQRDTTDDDEIDELLADCARPFGSAASLYAGKGNDREWDQRYEIAVATGMLPRPPSWKREPRVQCRARVGMGGGKLEIRKQKSESGRRRKLEA
jgi:hypothetical protein